MNTSNLSELEKIADLAIQNVNLIKKMRNDEWENIQNLSSNYIKSFYRINEVSGCETDLVNAMNQGNALIERYMKYFNNYLKKVDIADEDDNFRIVETDFLKWFEVLVERDVKKILEFDNYKIMEHEIDNSFYLRALAAMTRHLREIIGYPNERLFKICNGFCVQVPMLFPNKGKDLINIGMTLNCFYYLCWLGGRIKMPGSITSSQTHENCLLLFKVAKALSRS